MRAAGRVAAAISIWAQQQRRGGDLRARVWTNDIRHDKDKDRRLCVVVSRFPASEAEKCTKNETFMDLPTPSFVA